MRIIAALIVAAVVGVGFALPGTATEAPAGLQAGDRFQYNVTDEDGTRTFLGEYAGVVPYTAADGAITAAPAIIWMSDDHRVTQFGSVAKIEYERASRDGWEYQGMVLTESGRGLLNVTTWEFPAARSCLDAGVGPCYLAPLRNWYEDGNVTMRDDLPVPLRVDLAGVSMELVGFDHEGRHRPAPADALPEIDRTSSRAGPASRGAYESWPFWKAYNAALSAPEFSGLRDWLAAHPDAYVAGAELRWDDLGYQGDGHWSHAESWHIRLSDGEAGYQTRIERQMTHADGAGDLGLPRGPVPLTVLPGQPRGSPIEAVPIAPDELPAIPTIASLVERVEAAAPERLHGLMLRGMEFGLVCGDPCTGAEWRFDLLLLDEHVRPAASTNTLVLPDQDVRVIEASLLGDEIVGFRTVESEFRLRSGVPGVASTPAPAPPRDAADVAAVPGVLAATTTFVVAWVLLKFLLPLFSRVAPDELLRHPHRAAIHALVASEPGIHREAARKRLGLASGTFTHHLGKLAQGGRLQVRKVGSYSCLFPDAVKKRDLGMAAVRSDGARRIVEAIRQEPGIGLREVARTTDLDVSSVHYHVKRLTGAGVLTDQREGRERHLYVA